jgi:molecular chaperone DnaK
VSDPIVGIDLGTSNSVVAHADVTGSVQVLADDSGGKVHPSVVSFHPSGGVVVGAAAKQRKVIDPQNTIYSIKRLIGRSYRSAEVHTAKARSPFQIKEGPNAAPMIVTRAGEFAVPEISAIVLDHVRNIASARLEAPVNRAVVTVPASFNDAQRSATATAGAIAGLTVVRVLNEPTAAALAYGHTRHLREIIAVYDFGGGTFDITFLRLEDHVYEVLGTAGDTFLGGDDLDERLVEKMVAKFLSEHRIDLRTNEVSMMRLRAVAEQTKIELSRRSRAIVRVDEIAYGPRGVPLNLQIEIARDEFVQDIADLVDRTFPVCTEALALANLSVDRIADVILVGGTTKVPYVRDQVARFFGKAPRTDVNPEDAVATGAALQATSLERILSRRASSKIVVPRPPTDAAAAEETTTSGTGVLELADPRSVTTPATPATPALARSVSERTKRPTGAYSGDAQHPASEPARPDTGYSVTRAGVRDAVAEPERYPAAAATQQPATPPAPPSVEERTPLPQPLGRITRPVPTDPPAQHKTMFGVPAGPDAFEVELGSAGLPGEGSQARPITATETASPPPLPTATMRQDPGPRGPMQPMQATTPRPPDLRALDPRPRPPPAPSPQAPNRGSPRRQDWQASDSAAETHPDSWAVSNPATTQPMAPTTPIAPPTAPTLVALAADYAAASTARGIGAQASVAEPSPAATTKGFQPPQSYPVQPLMPAAPMPPPPAPAPPRPPPVLLEVTPRGLGIATVAGFCEELIRRNSRVPAEIRKLFTTSRDQQDLVRIVVCQGESRRLDNNTVIGDLVLQNLPRRPRGETSIEVTFSLDPTGVLHVRARDAQTGVEQRATLALVGGVAQEDLAASRERLQQLRR